MDPTSGKAGRQNKDTFTLHNFSLYYEKLMKMSQALIKISDEHNLGSQMPK